MVKRRAKKRKLEATSDVPQPSTTDVQCDTTQDAPRADPVEQEVLVDISHDAPLADPTVKDMEEKELEDSVFGAEEDFAESIAQFGGRKKEKKAQKHHKRHIESDAVWQDDEDESTAVAPDKLSEPNWAKLDWEKSDDSDASDTEANGVLQKTGDYLRASGALPKTDIQMKKCTDANKERPSAGKLKSVEFHPKAQVLLTGGMDGSLNLFQVDGKDNRKIVNLFQEKFPIYSAHFTRDGSEVIMSSRHRGFKYYDMIAGNVVNVPKIKGMEENNMKRMIMSPDEKYIVFLGNDGAIHFLSAKSKEWIDSVQMNGSVESAAFNSDGSKLFSVGDDGEAYVWDVNSRSAVHRFHDEGCVKATSLAVSPNDKYIAIGSNTGVVNVYDETCLQSSNPTPVKAVMNLVSECTDLKFNATTEILAMASNCTEQALKFLHVPSLSVFKNFPDRSEGLRIPFCMDFSVNSGYFCCGNHRGNALLFRVKHYSSY